MAPTLMSGAPERGLIDASDHRLSDASDHRLSDVSDRLPSDASARLPANGSVHGPADPRAHRRRSPSPAAEGGFGLIEVLVAMVILIVGLLALVSVLDTATKASMTTHAREQATNLARQIIEDARTVPYPQIVPTSIDGELEKMSGLKDVSEVTGWQIERHGFIYTVTVEECAIDDPKDGLATEATHKEAKTFCAGQENWASGTVDSEPEDLKRITAKVAWTIQKNTSTEEQVSTLTAAGQAVGLIATKLELTLPFKSTEPVIGTTYAAPTTTLTFSVSFPEGASAIDWSLEGAKQEQINVTSNATSATFSWAIGELSDGTYQVSAQTVSSTGVVGPPISIQVRLIRGEPIAPTGIVGGFNTVYSSGTPTEVAELQWKANSERDVIGYRVYGPAKELICPGSTETLSTATSCTDFNLPAKSAEREYSVVALYRNATGALAESKYGAVKIERANSTAPNPPSALILTKEANGSVKLSWTAPAAGGVSFYRIYRGSTNYSDRYGETSAREFTDTAAATGASSYWVTAVGPHLTESESLGPVSG